MEARLDSLKMDFEKKVEGILQYRAECMATAKALADELYRLKRKQESMEKRSEWLRNYVKAEMEKLGIGKVSTLTFSATVAKSPAAVIVEDAEKLPEFYQRVKTVVEADKACLLEAWKLGNELPPGVSIKQGTNLRIS